MALVVGAYIVNQLRQSVRIGVRNEDGVVESVVVPGGTRVGPYWYSRLESQVFELARRGALTVDPTTISVQDLVPDLAWWKLDETVGSTATDSVGSYTMPVVGANWDRGLICAGDGASGIAAVGVPARWRQPAFSVSIWITPYIRNDLINQGPPSYYKPAPGSAYSLDIPGQGGPGVVAHLVESVNTASTDAFADNLVTGPISGLLRYPGKTFHVLMVHGVTDDVLYLDGVEVARGPSVGLTNTVSSFRIGYHNDDPSYGSSRFFKGRVQDVRVYGRELSATDAVNLHSEGPNGVVLGSQLTSYIWPVSRGTGLSFNCLNYPAAVGSITGSEEWYADGFRFRGSKRGLADVSSLSDLPEGEVPWWMSFTAFVADSSPAYGQFVAYGQSGSGSRMLGTFYSKHPDPVMSWFIPGVASGYFPLGLIPDAVRFHHYVLAYVPGSTNASLTLWIDGVNKGTETIPLVNVLRERLYLGEDNAGQSDSIEGYIRNVRLGAGAVTQEQVHRLWLADRIPVVPVYARFMSVTPSGTYGYTAPVSSDTPIVGSTIVSNAYPNSGYAFVRWTSPDVTFTTDDRSPDVTCVMPSSDIHLVAEFASTYTKTLTLVSATGFLVSGQGTLPNPVPGSRWQLYADSVVGSVFDHWEVTPSALAGIFDTASDGAVFSMPSENVTVTAKYRVQVFYNVTLTDGFGGGPYEEGTAVYIDAYTPSPGYEFSAWTGSVADVALLEGTQTYPSTGFTMPARHVSLTATYVLGTYYLWVSGGTGSGSYNYNAVIPIVAGAPPTGYHFSYWDYAWWAVSVDDPYSATTNARYLADDASITAVYEPD